MQHQFRTIDSCHSLFYGWFEALHTRIDIILCDVTCDQGIEITSGIESLCDKYTRLFNRFDCYSALALLHASAGKRRGVRVDPLITEAVHDCISHYYKTLGYFDITVHSKNKLTQGISFITTDLSTSTVTLQHPDLRLDMGGYAKGYALDGCIKIIKQSNVANAFISIGNSSIAALGSCPNNTGWPIVLPHGNSIVLFDEILTTSGNITQTNHIINPQTGETAEAPTYLSVVTSTGTVGEVLSTSLFVAPVAKHDAILKEYPTARLIL